MKKRENKRPPAMFSRLSPRVVQLAFKKLPPSSKALVHSYPYVFLHTLDSRMRSQPSKYNLNDADIRWIEANMLEAKMNQVPRHSLTSILRTHQALQKQAFEASQMLNKLLELISVRPVGEESDAPRRNHLRLVVNNT